MSDQINREYLRTLGNYQRALEDAKALITAELAAVDEHAIKGYRFEVRHGLLELAEVIRRTDAKLAVFNNFIWNPRKEPTI